MKKLLLLVAAILAFTWTALAQGGTTAQGTSTSKDTKAKSAASDTKAPAKMAPAKAAGSNTITGCLGKSDGGYTIANGRYKKGIPVTTDKDLSAHVGHKVQLTGTLNKGAKPAFAATDMKHLEATCTVAGGKTSGAKTSKSSGDKAAAPKTAPK